MATHAHMLFNAFARSLVLSAKKHSSPNEKSTIKKSFRLFDSSSADYADEFVARVLDKHNISQALGDDMEVLPGVKVSELRSRVPECEKSGVEGAMNGMVLAAYLVQNECNDKVTSEIVTAVLASSVEAAKRTVIDEDLEPVLSKVVQSGIVSEVEGSLQKLKLQATSNDQGVGLLELAQEVSQGLDLSALAGSSGAVSNDDEAMANLFQTINHKVVERMRDGSIDPMRLCAEASSILGSRR